ncbi:hypothetical protein V8F06_009349 [Rhypophila decipiens]
MSKIGGTSDAEVIRILRKELAKANEELQSYRGLRAENARLRQELRFFKETAKPTEERGKIYTVGHGSSSRLSCLSNSISTTLASTSSKDSSDYSSPPSRKLDISKSVGIEGEKRDSYSYGWYQPRYVYEAGEPKELPARLSRHAVLPRFMHPTQASEARVHDSCLVSDSEQATRTFIKKGKRAEKYLTDKETERRREEEALREDQAELGFEKYTRDQEIISSGKSGYTAPLEGSFFARDFIFSESFHAAARAHWPRIWPEIAEGPHLLRCAGDEMESYLRRISIPELQQVCPFDPVGLRGFLGYDIRRIRNALAHPVAERFQYVWTLDDDLKGLQICLIMMCDGPRARKVRALRDELTRAAQERAHLDTVMEGFRGLPFDESEEDWDPSFPEPAAWKGIIEDEMQGESNPDRDAEAKGNYRVPFQTELPEYAKRLLEEHGCKGYLDNRNHATPTSLFFGF